MHRFILTLAAVFLTNLVSFAGNPDDSEKETIIKNLSLQDKRASGQPSKIFNRFSIGGQIGVSWMMGDLSDYKIAPPLNQLGGNTGFNWSAFARKEFKYGLGVKFQFDKGDLNGGRQIGNESPWVRYETQYHAFNLMLSFNLMDAVFGDKHQSRFYLLAEAGGGITFFRSLTFWGEGPELIRDFEGYTTTDEPATQRYQNMERTKMSDAINIPVGLTAGYMINHRVDVNAQVMLNNVMTDRLETWARDRSARDKYAFVSVGLRYNFNRSADDMPERKKRNKKKSAAENVSPNELDLGDKLKPVRGFKSKKKREDEMMKAMMRMYELQLQLFQLQYLAK